MGMFENYQNIPECYTPQNRCSRPDVRLVPECIPLAAYNAKEEFIGFTWNYGDNIVLEFETTGEAIYDDADLPGDFYEDADMYLKDKVFTLRLYNFRHEVVVEACVPAATKVKFYVDSKTYPDLCKGTYHYTLTCTDKKPTMKTRECCCCEVRIEPDPIQYTLLGQSDGLFIIK